MRERGPLPIAEACELGGIFNEEELLQRSLSALHSLLCAPLDRNCSATLRTHNEQLRCFEVLGQLYPEATLSFLLKAQRIEARLPEKDVDRPAEIGRAHV